MKCTSIEEKLLFIFAMRTGALVTYVMINAMRPLPNKKRLVNVKTNGKEEKVDLLPRDKRLQTQLWVKNAIDPIQMLWEFVSCKEEIIS